MNEDVTLEIDVFAPQGPSIYARYNGQLTASFPIKCPTQREGLDRGAFVRFDMNVRFAKIFALTVEQLVDKYRKRQEHWQKKNAAPKDGA